MVSNPDYSKSSIYKKVNSNEFVQNTHYYRQDKKLMFDKNEIDNWVRGYSFTNNMDYRNSDTLVDEIMGSL